MAAPELTLTVIRSPTVIDEVHGIWQWNAEHYSPPHADAYHSFLEKSIDDLGRLYAQGKTVAVRPDLRYILMRRKSKGHGHVAVYRFDDKEVNVVHVFHTAQDWQTKLADKPLSQ